MYKNKWDDVKREWYTENDLEKYMRKMIVEI